MLDQRVDTARDVPSPSSGRIAPIVAKVDSESLAAAIAAAVEQTPGVDGLQPTLASTGLRGLIRRNRTDGVHVLVRGDLVDADIYLATHATHKARTVAAAVQARVTDVISVAGHLPGATTVNVLSISSSRPQAELAT